MHDLPTNLPLLALPEAGLRPLLRAIQECVDDDLPRRALADWLEEHGDARAVLIRTGLTGEGRRAARWWDVYGEKWLGELPPGARVEATEGLISLVWPAGRFGRPELVGLPPGLWGAIEEGWVGRLVMEGAFTGDVWELAWWQERIPRLRWAGAYPWAPRLAHPGTRELDLSFSPGLTEYHSEGGATALEVLRLRECPELQSVRLIDAHVLASLDLSGCQRLTHLELTRLPCLADLDLTGCSSLTELTARDLSSLRCLLVDELHQVGRLTLRDLPALVALNLTRLPSLTAFTAARLGALTRLDLTGCDLLRDLSLEGLGALHRLSLRGCHSLPDRAFRQLGGLPALHELDLGRCGQLETLTLRGQRQLEDLKIDGCVALRTLELRDLPALRRLEAADCPRLTGEVLGTVAGLPSLRVLDMRGVALSSEAIAGATWPHSLQVLLIGDDLGPEELRLAGLPSLRLLRLAPCRELRRFALAGPSRVQSIDLSARPLLRAVRLRGLDSLRELSLRGCRKLGSLELNDLPGLRVVHLGDCERLGDEAIETLGQMPRLEKAILNGARGVSRGAIQKLRARLPHCRVQV